MVGIGERIKKFRKAAGFTQVSLAKKIHLSQSYIANIENNVYNPSLDTLNLIAKALNVDIAEFIGNIDTIQETGLANDEIHLIMNFRDLADNDKITVQNLITSLKFANRQGKNVKSTPLMNYDTSKIANTAGLVSGRA